MQVDVAAERLWEANQRGNFTPKELLGTLDFNTALQVQLKMLSYRRAAGEIQIGWKIGLTSPAVRASFGTTDQPFGYLLESGLYHSGDVITIQNMRGECGVEPELCWTLAHDLPGPNATPEQAQAAVETVYPGFEINEKRSGDVKDFGLTIANNLTQWGIVIGDPVDPRKEPIDLDRMRVEMRCNGETQATSVGKEVIDDHYLSLATLANALSRHGQCLTAGQRVITGSYSKHAVTIGQRWEAEFKDIGVVRIDFA